VRIYATAAGFVAGAILAGVVWSGTPVRGAGQTGRLPGRLEDFVRRQVRLSSAEYTRLFQGEAVCKVLPTSTPEEVAIFGAIWIKEPFSVYLAAVKDIERFHKGRNVLTKRISSPPRIEDFAGLTLPAEDVEDLKTCRVEKCEIKLSEDSLLQLQRNVDWTKPVSETTAQVDALFRSMALEYAARYERAGNAELAEYRDKKRPTFVAREFEAMVNQMPSLADYLPQVKHYLLAYPNASLPGPHSSFLFWQSLNFGMKPTIRINHLVIVEQPDAAAVVTKMLYSNHYFWTALELHLLMPDPPRGKGFWLVNISQSRSDGLTGFTGTLLRGKVRTEAQKAVAAALEAGKASLEKSSRYEGR